MTAAEWIFHGGLVRTMDRDHPISDEVAVAGGRVIAIGRDQVREHRTPRTEAVDLAGGVLLPGFHDGHVHPIGGGLQRLACDLSESHSRASYRQTIADYARAHPELEWIDGAGWYGDVFPGGFPDRHELDAVVPDRPVALISHDGHGTWVNSLALRLAGIGGTTPDPEGGRIVRDADGVPTGMLMESAADLVSRLVPRPSDARLRSALLHAQSYLHSLGITGWQDAAVGEALGVPDTYEIYRGADADGSLTASVTGALWWQRDRGLEQIPELVARRRETTGGRFRATAVKIMQDGVCENLTAALLSAYAGHPQNQGMSFIEPDVLTSIVERLDHERFDIHLHAVGDRAVRECLDAIEASGASAWDQRHQLAHIDLIDPADVARMRDLGVIANIQPLWARQDPVLVETKLPYLDTEQRRRHFAFADLSNAAVPLAMGSDWPVSSPDPLWGIHVAVNRTAPPGDQHAQDPRSQCDPLLAEQAIDVETALRAYTSGAARANRCEQDSGTISAGKSADLVVLDQDPLGVGVREIASIEVRMTMARGETVFVA